MKSHPPAKLLRSVVGPLCVALAGCSGFGLSTGDGSGGGGSGGTGGSGGSTSASVTGVDCGSDPDTGATLCLGISACPGFLVDTDSFPNCGFRISGSAIDLECLCTGELCSAGATTCTAVEQVMKTETYVDVCNTLSDGLCTDVSSGTAPDAAAKACTQNCVSMCAGDPTCIAACSC